MTVNRYINKTNRKSEQNLMENILVEYIQMYGVNMQYLPRKMVIQPTFNEDAGTSFDSAYEIEMLDPTGGQISNVNSIMAKIGGIVFQGQTELFLSKRRFNELRIPDRSRPNEGDLIWWGDPDDPVASYTNKLFQITEVTYADPQFSRGKNYCYKLAVENATLSYERFRTGIAAIDMQYDSIRQTADPQARNAISANAKLNDMAAVLEDFDTMNPFNESFDLSKPKD